MQLSPIESCRVQCIIEDTTEKLIFLGALIPEVVSHQRKDELVQTVGVEISRVIEEQKRLEQRYAELVAQRSQLRALSNKSKYKEKQGEIEAVACDLRHATKMLCRNLKDNPNVAENLLKIESERINLLELLQKTLDELQKNTFQTLLSSVETERQKIEVVKVTVTKEKEASIEVQKLREDVEVEVNERERDKNSQSDEILTAKEDLQELKAKTAIDTKYMRKEAKAHTTCSKRLYHTKVQALSEDINIVQKSLEIEMRVNKESVNFLEAKHEALQEEIQNWITKYDQDIEEKEREIENLKISKADDLVRLYDLRAKYKEVEAQVNRERRKQEARALAKEMDEKRTKAAIKIQSLWRRYKARKLYLKMKAGKKKEKKKGKSPTRKGSPTRNSPSRGKPSGKKSRPSTTSPTRTKSTASTKHTRD